MILVSLCATGILGWAFAALARRILTGRVAAAVLSSKITAQEDGRRQIKTLEALARERRQDIDRIRAFFPPRDRPLTFIQEIERLGDATKTAVVLDVDESKNDSAHLGFRVTADGDEQAVRTLTRLIELLPYEITPEELMFQKNAPPASSGLGRSGESRITMTLRVLTR